MAAGVTRFYYNDRWQVLEERHAGEAAERFVWSAAYIDAMVLRDRLSPDTTGDGHADERLYVLQDANHNVTAVADASGAVVQRYAYDPYGTRTVLDAAWHETAAAPLLRHGHQGGRHDDAAGAAGAGGTGGGDVVHFRHRDLLTAEGRWNKPDPLGYIDGMNTYEYVGGNPASESDPSGLFSLGGLFSSTALSSGLRGKEAVIKSSAAGGAWGALSSVLTEVTAGDATARDIAIAAALGFGTGALSGFGASYFNGSLTGSARAGLLGRMEASVAGGVVGSVAGALWTHGSPGLNLGDWTRLLSIMALGGASPFMASRFAGMVAPTVSLRTGSLPTTLNVTAEHVVSGSVGAGIQTGGSHFIDHFFPPLSGHESVTAN